VDVLTVPAPVPETLGTAGSQSLVKMFAEAHRLATASFERQLGEEMSRMRLEMASLKFDLLKWTFLFWIGQLAALTAILSVLLRDVR
jgi:hypothetical protein